MGLPRCARTPFGSKSWTKSYAPTQQQPMPPSKKTHPKHHVIGGPPQWDDFPHQLHVCSRWSCTAKHRETKLDIPGMLRIELFRLQTAAQIFNLAFMVDRSPKPQAHSASLGSTLKSPGRQDFVPKNLGVSLASRKSPLLSHLLSSLDVLWKLTGFPVGSSKKFLSNRWLKNGNNTGQTALSREWRNEVLHAYIMVIMGIHSLIPYKGQPEKQTIVTCWWTWILNETIPCYSTKPLYSTQTTPFLPATILNRLIWEGPIILSSHIHQPSLSIWVIGASVTSNFTVQKIPVIQVMLASDSEFTTGPSIRKRQDSCRHTTWKPKKCAQKNVPSYESTKKNPQNPHKRWNVNWGNLWSDFPCLTGLGL